MATEKKQLEEANKRYHEHTSELQERVEKLLVGQNTALDNVNVCIEWHSCRTYIYMKTFTQISKLKLYAFWLVDYSTRLDFPNTYRKRTRTSRRLKPNLVTFRNKWKLLASSNIRWKESLIQLHHPLRVGKGWIPEHPPWRQTSLPRPLYPPSWTLMDHSYHHHHLYHLVSECG